MIYCEIMFFKLNLELQNKQAAIQSHEALRFLTMFPDLLPRKEIATKPHGGDGCSELPNLTAFAAPKASIPFHSISALPQDGHTCPEYSCPQV